MASSPDRLPFLAYAKKQNFIVKSGIMLGLGETEKELAALFKDLKNSGCDILTIGQYFAARQRQRCCRKRI
jgi:lipoic acid synthetase